MKLHILLHLTCSWVYFHIWPSVFLCKGLATALLVVTKFAESKARLSLAHLIGLAWGAENGFPFHRTKGQSNQVWKYDQVGRVRQRLRFKHLKSMRFNPLILKPPLANRWRHWNVKALWAPHHIIKQDRMKGMIHGWSLKWGSFCTREQGWWGKGFKGNWVLNGCVYIYD